MRWSPADFNGDGIIGSGDHLEDRFRRRQTDRHVWDPQVLVKASNNGDRMATYRPSFIPVRVPLPKAAERVGCSLERSTRHVEDRVGVFGGVLQYLDGFDCRKNQQFDQRVAQAPEFRPG